MCVKGIYGALRWQCRISCKHTVDVTEWQLCGHGVFRVSTHTHAYVRRSEKRVERQIRIGTHTFRLVVRRVQFVWFCPDSCRCVQQMSSHDMALLSQLLHSSHHACDAAVLLFAVANHW